MWHGHREELCYYGTCCYKEWQRRKLNKGITGTALEHKSGQWISENSRVGTWYKWPEWLGRTDFHLSHQSNLVRKDPEFYGPQFPGVPGDLPYVWPSKDII